MAVERVILHLGMPKAGSRSIQETLYNNANILEKDGFKYLTEWRRNHLDKLHYLFSPYPVKPIYAGNLGKPLVNRGQQNKDTISKMLRVLNTTDCKTIILSGEYFHELHIDATIENIKMFLEKYFHSNNTKTTIAYVIRNPLTWLVSWVQQRYPHNGYPNKNCDFFSTAIEMYKGIINLQKNFPDSLKIIKFEDACLDKDGFVENFLKEIGFPEAKLNTLNVYRANESRCMEVMEFIHFIEAIEPRYPDNNYRQRNPNRFLGDLNFLRHIKGKKFDLPYQGKVELWERLQKTIYKIKENTGIDYTSYKIPAQSDDGEETYSSETLQGFIETFPRLSFILQRHFLKFFEKKYMETAQEKFKQMHFKDSVPWKIYNSKNALFSLINLRSRYRLQEIRESLRLHAPQPVKAILKGALKK